MSQIPRRNGWTIAEQAGDRTPDKTQRLLSRAVWDTAAAMRAVRRFAVAGLDQAARTGGRRGLAVGAIDETSQVKQGERTAGVKRHYLGCAGLRRESSQRDHHRAPGLRPRGHRARADRRPAVDPA
jgi:SRSO17 transposase